MSRKVARDLVGSTIGVVSSVLGTIVVFIVASRALGPDLFGRFSFSYAITSILGLLFDFGYPVSFLRETRKPDTGSRAELPAQALALKATLFFLLTPVALAAPFIVGTDSLVGLGLWCGVSLISFANFFSTMLRALGFHSRDAVNLLLANLAGLAVAVAVYIAKPADWAFSLVFIVIGLVYLALTLRLWVSHCRLSGGRFVWTEIVAEMRKNLVYVLDALGRRSFGFIDVAILGFFAPFETVGFYQAGQKVTQSVSIFAQPFNNVLLPRLARSAGDGAAFRRKARTAFVAQIAFGLIAGAALVAFGPLLVTWLFSAAFAPAKGLLVYFAALIAVRYATSALTISKTAEGFIRERLYSNLFGVAALLIIGPILTHLAGAKGLLIGLVLSALLGAAALVLLTIRRSVSE